MESGPSAVPPYVAGPLQLVPFRALSLSPTRVGDPASARAFARPYRGVGQRLETWCRRGFARRDDTAAIYLHEYSDSGLTVRGLVGCLDISRPATTPAERRLFPHEAIHPRQVTELAHRMGSMGINPAPILLVHQGPTQLRDLSRAVRSRRPDQEYQDHAGQHHRIWAISDAGSLESVQRALADARLVVADGHHRYAAYVAMHERDPSDPRRSGLAMIIDQAETPLFLGAIHRVFHGPRVSDLVRSASAAGADVVSSDQDHAMAALARDTLVLTDGERWATVRVPLEPGTTVVQRVEEILLAGLSRRPSRVTFAHSAAQALSEAGPRRVTAALLPAVDFDVVVDVVGSGALLPEKATSFQPKPSLGSFIRLLDE